MAWLGDDRYMKTDEKVATEVMGCVASPVKFFRDKLPKRAKAQCVQSEL